MVTLDLYARSHSNHAPPQISGFKGDIAMTNESETLYQEGTMAANDFLVCPLISF